RRLPRPGPAAVPGRQRRGARACPGRRPGRRRRRARPARRRPDRLPAPGGEPMTANDESRAGDAPGPAPAFLPDAAPTHAGRRRASLLGGGVAVPLPADLGAGNATLVRALLRELGHEGPVRSPTYALVESYDIAGLAVYHLDLYRTADPDELEFIGLRDWLQ